MDSKRYAAPMEGLTTWLWRRVHSEIFGGADKYFTPFLSPNANRSFQSKELREIADPAAVPLVPQLLTASADHFAWAARELAERGYREINLNAGCPAGTVTAKHKGAGLLLYPDELDALLEGIFTALPDLTISVKTRVGYLDEGEWPTLLAIYERYPIHELIVHPRVRREQYGGAARRELFRRTKACSMLPLVYNGDVTDPADVAFSGPVMVGRGLMADPALLRRSRGGPPASRQELADYLAALEEGYEACMDGGAALHKLWELWAYLITSFPGGEPWLKKMRKCRTLAEYRPIARRVLEELTPVWEQKTEGEEDHVS